MGLYKVDFNISAWMKNLEIVADSEDEARSILANMTLGEILDQATVKSTDITEVNIVEDAVHHDLSELDDFARLTHHIEWIVDPDYYNEATITEVEVDSSNADKQGTVYITGHTSRPELDLDLSLDAWDSVYDYEVNVDRDSGYFKITLYLEEV